MLCAVCQRPLLEGVTACIMCGAPIGPPPEVAPAPGDPSAMRPMPQFDAYAPSAAPPGAAGGPMPMPPPPFAPFGPFAPRGPAGSPFGYGPAPMTRVPDNGMALASFVCGLLGLVPFWIGFVLCVLAVVFGVLGLQRANGVAMGKGRGLAIAGIVLGLAFVLPASCGL